MARRKYLIISSDGRKRHVDREERNHLFLSGVLTQIGPEEYRCELQPVTLHSFPELERIKPQFQEENLKRHFLPVQFIVEYPSRLGGRRERELLQTPESMALQLNTPSGPCCKFNADYALQESKRRAA